MRASTLVVPICALALAFSGAGCAPASAQLDKLAAAAKAEGGFMLYTAISDAQSKVMLTGFEAQYGIKGTFLRLASGPLIQRFVAANDGGGNDADAYIDSSLQVFEQYAPLFATLDRAQLPNLANWPAKWVATNSITLQTSAVVVQYNTDAVPPADVPKTWADLVDPRWKGRIVLTDPRVSETYLGLFDELGRRFGAPYLEKLAAQDFKLTQSGASGAQLVAAGSAALNFPAYASFSIPLIEKKAPIATQVVGGPVFVNQTSIGIVARAAHPNAARLFLDYVLSDAGISALCKEFPISTPGDPAGKLGCMPVQNPEQLPYKTADDRRQIVLRALGLAGTN